jgi:hypothetical protein
MKLAVPKNERERRESFDSATGYVTPSMSSFNMSSPVRPSREIPLTNDALEKMQLERGQISPELDLPAVDIMPSSPPKKRKREDDLKGPASPEKSTVVPPPTKKRNAEKKVHKLKEIPDSQVPETPEKELTKPGQKAIGDVWNGRKPKGQKNDPIEVDLTGDAKEDPIEVESVSDDLIVLDPKSTTAIIMRAIRRKSLDGNKPAETKEPKKKAQKQPQKPQKQPEKKDPTKSAPQQTTSKKESKAAAAKQNTRTPLPGAELKTEVRNDNSVVTGANATTVKPAPKNPTAAKESKNSPAARTYKQPPMIVASNKALDVSSESSPTVVFTSNVKQSETKNASTTEPSSKEAEPAKQSFERVKPGETRQLAKKRPVPLRRAVPRPSKAEDKPSVTASAKPIVGISVAPASRESSSSDTPSDKSSSGSTDLSTSSSTSDSDSSENDASDSSVASASDSSDESDSDSDSDSSSKSAAKSRGNTAAQEEAPDDRSSSSSNIVALSLGGQPSSTIKPLQKDLILHRKPFIQETDTSANNPSLSQQSPLATFASNTSRLHKWGSLSDFSERLKNGKITPTQIPKQEDSQEEESSVDDNTSDTSSDSDSDKSEEEDEGGIPKEKLAGRISVGKKRKSGGFEALRRGF